MAGSEAKAARRRWRGTQRRIGPIGAVRAVAAWVSALLLRVAYGGSGPVRLAVGLGVAAVWLAFSIPAALRIAFETGAAAPLADMAPADTAKRAADFFEVIVDIEVRDVKHLTGIIAALRASPSIASVDRLKGWDGEEPAEPELKQREPELKEQGA